MFNLENMGIHFSKGRIQFNRHELAGSFGDIGTDFPLIVSLILVCGLEPASVLIMFGLAQMATGLVYKLPMPVQPLKAMAVIALTQRLPGEILYGGGLAIGILMLVLSLSGLINWIAKTVPLSVVRGIQFGLGLQLAGLALKDYVPAEGLAGYILAFVSFVLTLMLLKNKKYPAALVIILLGIIYAVCTKIQLGNLLSGIGLNLPKLARPALPDVWTGFWLLALPQVCLSIGNSILATRQVVEDFFPEQKISVRKISLTYSFLNLVMPFFRGIPVCHGSGGIAGHYTFGARTGGSVIIYGVLYLGLGIFLSPVFGQVIEIFPRPVLGVVLFFEGWALLKLIADRRLSPTDLGLALLVGLMAANLAYGYVLALILGTTVHYLRGKYTSTD